MKTFVPLSIVALLIAAAPAWAADCGNELPRLLAPADRAEDLESPLRLEWNEVEGAVAYRVSIVEEELDIDVVAETSTTSTSIRLEPGSFGWFVEALFDDCAAAISEVRTFEMAEAGECENPAPVLVSPADGATAAPLVTFSWHPVPGAIAYEVSAALDDGEPGFVGETTGTSLTASLGAGRVRWIVEAEFNGCDETESEEGSFAIARDPSCENAAPLLIAPAFAAVDVPERVEFVWTPVVGATSYSVLDVTDDVRVLGTTAHTRLTAHVPAGPRAWTVRAEFGSCPPESSPIATFTARRASGCATPRAPEVSIAPRSRSGDTYQLNWSAASEVALHEVQEATRPDFSDAVTWPSNDILLARSHEVPTSRRFYYRVRSLGGCGAGEGPWSDVASIVVDPDVAPSSEDADYGTAYGGEREIVGRVRIPGSTAPVSFSAATDRPWISVTPRSGTIPPEGFELIVTANVAGLPMGSNDAAIELTYGAAGSKRGGAAAGLPSSLPVSIHLAAPVSPDAGSSPLPGSLIIPGVAHLDGIDTWFESDVRLLNAAAQAMRYLLSFTLSGTNGTKEGFETTIQLAPGQLAALDDIIANFFGSPGAGANASGALEIRPLSGSLAGVAASPELTFASSRTYAVSSTGTLGQFIPAIPFVQFIGGTLDPNQLSQSLHLFHVAQSSAYRTNVGLVEGSGAPATVALTIFGDTGERLAELSVDLKPGEHRQLNSLLRTLGLSSDNARIEVRVESPAGRVTAYASVIDNASGDPMCVFPANPARARTRRVTLPGIAHLDTGETQWRSEIRLFNEGESSVEAELMFVPEGASSGSTTKVTAGGGQVLMIEDVVEGLFKSTGQGGSVIVTTEVDSRLVASARTFNEIRDGTYGQFIPAIGEHEGVGAGERALQILQLEESERFRTNLGVVELTGSPVVVELTVLSSTALVGAAVEIALEANEYRQLNGLLRHMGIRTDNARATLRVKSGNGRVGGYASVIDNRTGDPTYVPAQ